MTATTEATTTEATTTATTATGAFGALSPTAIEVSGVSKRFRKHSEPAKTLKERLLTLRGSTVHNFEALSDIDFDVKIGETFGILGHNGSGKSTLLKCIAGTIRPSVGMVRVRGRLSALLELGAGFHPDLTGRENVYLNGSILGFSKDRIDDIFDDIVSFAGLEDFIDTQVKHYSSGMYARLGFAVAVNVEPDVLLIDEVLAVGDEAFQRKCIERIRGFQTDGRTICLVTHSPEMVRQLCDRALVLDHGHAIHIGDTNEAVTIYRRSLAEKGHEVPADPQDELVAQVEAAAQSPVRLLNTWIEPPPGERASHLPGDQVVVGFRFSSADQRHVRARLLINSHDGVGMLNVSTYDLNRADLVPTGPEHEARFVIDDLPFTDGRYLVTLILQEPDETREFDRNDEELAFEVSTGGPVHGRVVMNVTVDDGPRR